MGDDEILRAALPERAACLRRAEALTCGERSATYGPPTKNLADVAAMWSVFLGHEVTAQQVSVCMVLAKIARIMATPGHQDSHDDAAAYMAIAWECAVQEGKA
jgi:hypothetical protein